MPGLRLRPVHKFSKKLRRSILKGYSQFMSGDENGADPSYVGNDDVNTFYGDVIVAYPVPVVGNGIAQSPTVVNGSRANFTQSPLLVFVFVCLLTPSY